MIHFNIKGINDIKKAAEGLGKTLTNKILRKESRDGCKIMEEELRQHVPTISGHYQASLKVRSTGKRNKVSHRLYVDVNALKDPKEITPAYVESGHGNVKPHPYMRSAYLATKEKITKQIIDRSLAAIDKYKAGDS